MVDSYYLDDPPIVSTPAPTPAPAKETPWQSFQVLVTTAQKTPFPTPDPVEEIRQIVLQSQKANTPPPPTPPQNLWPFMAAMLIINIAVLAALSAYVLRKYKTH